MTYFWHLISYLGLPQDSKTLEHRSIILNNRINAVMAVSSMLILTILATESLVAGGTLGIGSLRTLLLLLLNITNLILAYSQRHVLSRSLLIYGSPLVFIIFPTITGFVEEESFVYYPYVLIAFSLIPQLVSLPGLKNTGCIVSLVYYIILIAGIDNFLLFSAKQTFRIVPIINSFYLYYKLAPLTIFVFLHTALFYLKTLNRNYEYELVNYNEELKATVEHLKRTQYQLIQSEKMASLGALVSAMVNELKDPLNKITGGVEQLKIWMDESTVKLASEDALAGYRMILEGTAHTERIVKSLVSFSSKEMSELVKTDIHQILDTSLFFIKSNLPKGVEIVRNYNLNVKVFAYQDKLFQIFVALFDNAASALKKSKSTALRLQLDTSVISDNGTDYAGIAIFNTGDPIDPNHFTKIFEPFFTTKPPGSGVGLGLSIVYSLVQDHKGRVIVENIPGGVQFTVQLPL
jgi:signal transduction histidine kinase